MKALVGAFNQEKALVGAFSVIVQPVVEPMEHYTALVQGAAAHVFVDPVLVDGPDGGHVGLHELGQRHGLEVGAGTHQPGLAHPAVPHQHHLDRIEREVISKYLQAGSKRNVSRWEDVYLTIDSSQAFLLFSYCRYQHHPHLDELLLAPGRVGLHGEDSQLAAAAPLCWSHTGRCGEAAAARHCSPRRRRHTGPWRNVESYDIWCSDWRIIGMMIHSPVPLHFPTVDSSIMY